MPNVEFAIVLFYGVHLIRTQTISRVEILDILVRDQHDAIVERCEPDVAFMIFHHMGDMISFKVIAAIARYRIEMDSDILGANP